MREGLPSATAARVAAYRLGFDRLAAPFGDPEADERLAADVAAGVGHSEPSERMGRYLKARTSFFDRVTVHAVERGVTQVVVVGAGYDARALRYAAPGVQWFEVDHPDTQTDKRARLERLAIDDASVTFVGLDLRHAGLSGALMAAGVEPDAPCQVLCEGVAAYLEADVLDALLAELRALATPGTRLALSSSVSLPAGDTEVRDHFAASVAAVGEPALATLDTADVPAVLDRARWRQVDVSERSQRAGFVVAAPAWRPARPPAGPTRSKVGAYMDRTFHRDGIDGLAGHLQATYDVDVSRLTRLDVGVERVDLADGRRWIARVFPASRPVDTARKEVAILRLLAESAYPAERPAPGEPVSVLHGQAVVVTEHIAGGKAPSTAASFGALGDLLGRLQTLGPSAELTAHPGGAWHHLATGGPDDELAAATALVEQARPRVRSDQVGHFDALRAALERADGCAGLPEALVHPDFVPQNALLTDGGLAVLDWAGAGWGPRLWPLAFLLWAAGQRNSRAVAARYRDHVELCDDELDRLPGAIATRAIVLGAWSFATGRQSVQDAAEEVRRAREVAAAIAAVV